MNTKVQPSNRTTAYLLRAILAGVLSLTAIVATPGQTLQAAAAAPANDLFPGTPVTTIPYNDLDVNTTDATSDTGGIADPEPMILGDCDSNKGVASVWYNYRPTQNTNLTIDTIGSGYDTVLAVWTGVSPNLTLVACSDDISLYEIQSKVGLVAQANTTYYIEVIEFAQPASSQAQASRTLNLHMDVDTTPPTVLGISRANLNPTKDATVDFNVTFSENVTGVDTNDFSLATTGSISGAAIIGLYGLGANYFVTVSTGTGVGTLQLNIPTSATITDLVSNPLFGLPYTTGAVYSVRIQTFADVPIDYWAWQYIERLYAAGITGGCAVGPLQYCPVNVVNRAQMAVFLLKSKHGPSYTPPPATGTMFNDVPVGYWATAWIEQLARESITSGCGGGSYCPEAPVTRDQMSVFLLKAKHGSSYTPPAATGDFLDVPISYWAAAWIEQLAAEGITGGCGASIYCPMNPVTRDQMAVFIVRAFSLP